MSPQIYFVPGQTEGKRKAFLGWKNIDLSPKLSLTCGGNVNYYKSVHHPIPTRRIREHPASFQNKSVSSPFNWMPRYILFLTKLKGTERPFLEGERRGPYSDIARQKHLVVISDEKVPPFLKFEITLPLLCFLLDFFTNKHCRTWSSAINLWIDSRTSQR